MKQPRACTLKRAFGLYVLMAPLLFRSAIARADVVLDWNLIAVNTAIANNQNSFAQARYGAMVQLAVFEPVNSITGDYHPYLGTITAPPGAVAEAAAIEAAYRVLVTYFPASKAPLDAELANSLESIPDGQAKADGIATGDSAASALIAFRANDGSSPPRFKVPGPLVPCEWQATPSCPVVNGVAVGLFFQWQYLTPFGIPSAVDFLLNPPPALTSNQYAKTYNEVMTVGNLDSTERPPDRANVETLSSDGTYTVQGATPEREAVLRHQIQLMQPSILPYRVRFVPHWQYLYAAKMYQLHVPTGMGSKMFTHLASRSVFIDEDCYLGEEWLGHWIAHELGHLATNSVKEEAAEKTAREYRTRLQAPAVKKSRSSGAANPSRKEHRKILVKFDENRIVGDSNIVCRKHIDQVIERPAKHPSH